MSDVKHRNACNKLMLFIQNFADKHKELIIEFKTEQLVSHYSIKRYVDVVYYGNTSNLCETICYEVKHDLKFDLGEECRKASDIKSILTNVRCCLVLPSGKNTIDFIEDNLLYLSNSAYDFIWVWCSDSMEDIYIITLIKMDVTKKAIEYIKNDIEKKNVKLIKFYGDE